MAKSSNYVCVRVGKSVERLPRVEADELVRNGKATYVPRSVWREETRDAGKVASESPKKRKGNPKGKAKKSEG